MFKHVLVPLDGSEAALVALDYAAIIPSDSLRLLCVVPDPGSTLLKLFAGGRRDQLMATAVDQATASLAEVAAALGRQGRVVEPLVQVGDPAERIVENAAAGDLIVMTTHGRGAGNRALWGSVADRVVRHAVAPVLVVRGGERPVASSPIGRLVVPLDGSPLAERALPVAISLAGDLGVPIHIVRALDVDMLRETVRAGASSAAAYAESVDAKRPAIDAYLEEQANVCRSRDTLATTELSEGTPVAELLRLTRPGDLIVMTTHGRSGLRRWLLGSVADKVVRDANVPVLLVRAETAAPS
jgi:nucleotide-binding universal stress UspA family protein